MINEIAKNIAQDAIKHDRSFKVLGTGSYVPPRVVTNTELEGFLDTSNEWIVERTGVKERHICTTETAADLAYQAALRALENAGVAVEELDMILCSTVSGSYVSPSLSCMVQRMLDATCPTMDINAACSAFVFMLDTAAGYFARGKVKKMLVVGAEQMSRLLDWDDRGTCIIFGDGAGAVVLGEGDNFLASKLYTIGGMDVIKIPTHNGKSPFNERVQENPYVHMEGQATFKFAVNAMCQNIQEVMDLAGLSGRDIDYVVPHQANIRIIESAKKRLGIAPEKFCCNIEHYGNTSSASIPIMLDEKNQAGEFKEGDILALSAFGGGLCSAACILRW
jgi:3-oxoacyl-[acyl-carrier-protein] synthase-3